MISLPNKRLRKCYISTLLAKIKSPPRDTTNNFGHLGSKNVSNQNNSGTKQSLCQLNCVKFLYIIMAVYASFKEFFSN